MTCVHSHAACERVTTGQRRSWWRHERPEGLARSEWSPWSQARRSDAKSGSWVALLTRPLAYHVEICFTPPSLATSRSRNASGLTTSWPLTSSLFRNNASWRSLGANKIHLPLFFPFFHLHSLSIPLFSSLSHTRTYTHAEPKNSVANKQKLLSNYCEVHCIEVNTLLHTNRVNSLFILFVHTCFFTVISLSLSLLLNLHSYIPLLSTTWSRRARMYDS